MTITTDEANSTITLLEAADVTTSGGAGATAGGNAGNITINSDLDGSGDEDGNSVTLNSDLAANGGNITGAAGTAGTGGTVSISTDGSSAGITLASTGSLNAQGGDAKGKGKNQAEVASLRAG